MIRFKPLETVKGWESLEAHALAAGYPLMNEEDAGDVAEGMGKHGFLSIYAVVLWEGKILDGRNRHAVALKTGVVPEFVEFAGTDDEARAFVEMANERRRHANHEEKVEYRRRRIVAAREAGKSLRAIAETEGISHTQVRKDLEDAGVAPPAAGATVIGTDGRPHAAARTPRAPKEVDAAAPLADETGAAVPERLRDEYADPWLAEGVDAITKLLGDFRKLGLSAGAKKRAHLHPLMAASEFLEAVSDADAALERAAEVLEQGRPYATCPRCKGDKKVLNKVCTGCVGGGFVTKSRHEQLTEGAA